MDTLIYYLQRNLATYSLRSLHVMAQHFLRNVVNVDHKSMSACDLRWLLALKLTEEKTRYAKMNGQGGDDSDDELIYGQQQPSKRRRFDEPDNYLLNLPKEMLMKIALNLDDESLADFCSAYPDTGVCEDEHFWVQKIKQKIDHFEIDLASWNLYCTRIRQHGLSAYLQFIKDATAVLDLYRDSHADAVAVTYHQLEAFAREFNYMTRRPTRQISTIIALVRFGATSTRVDNNGNNILHYRYNDVGRFLDASVEDFLPNIIMQNTDGDTPLHLIAQSHLGDEIDSVQKYICVYKNVLLNGRNPFNIQNNDGNTPLHDMLWTDFTYYNYQSNDVWKHVGDIVKCGADVDIQNNTGNTPLHKFARLMRRPSLIANLKICIDASRNLNIQNDDGDTVLHMLFYGTLPEIYVRSIASYLIQRGANPQIQNIRGEIPRMPGMTAQQINEQLANADDDLRYTHYEDFSDNDLDYNQLKLRDLDWD